eukprot:Tamp_35115.p2 GENE.Tamp_35115~~Tamp_35115.p2  ORF type:complete len:135 (+),score=37.39 Tamp_35115:40-444(+)
MSAPTEIGDALVAKGVDNMQVANCLIMCRPKSVEEAEAWMSANEDKAKAHIAGQKVPAEWTAGKDYYFAEGTPFDIGEVVALNRSDGSTKFGLVQQLDDPEPGVHVVLVECGQEMNSVKRLKSTEIGKLTLDKQ